MKLFAVALGASGFFLGTAMSVSAATLYLSPTSVEINRSDTVKLSLRLDVDLDECVNAVDATITYTENIEPIDISRGASIMSIWVEEPVINRENRTITFAGGIPNGYCGRIVGDPRLTNNIIDLVFQSPGFVIGRNQGTSSDVARIEVAEETQVYLNDGFGTRAAVQGYGAEVILNNAMGSTFVNPWNDIVVNDNQAPEEFSITLERTPNAFSNRYFITFNTTDKQSGIDGYEVMEEPLTDFWSFRWGAVDAPWIQTRSPYILKDQSLNSTIRVRAIDKAGNEYIATLVPDEAARTIPRDGIVVVGGAGVIAVVLLISLITYLVMRRRNRARAAVQQGAYEETDDYDYEADTDDDAEVEDGDEEVVEVAEATPKKTSRRR